MPDVEGRGRGPDATVSGMCTTRSLSTASNATTFRGRPTGRLNCPVTAGSDLARVTTVLAEVG